MAVGAARQTREHERDARGDADEAGSGAIEGADRVALGRRHARQGERRADLLPQSPEIAYREAAGGALSAAHQSDQPGSCPPMAVLHSTRRRGHRPDMATLKNQGLEGWGWRGEAGRDGMAAALRGRP